MLDFATVLRAPTFKVLIGSDGTCFNVPATLAKDISPPLYKLMNNSDMKEARDGVAVLKEVESEIFTAFCEYAYTGSYRVPKVTVDFQQSTPGSPSHHTTFSEPEASAANYETSVPEPTPEFDQIGASVEWSLNSRSKKDKKNKLKLSSLALADPRDEKPQQVEVAPAGVIKERYDHLWNKLCNLNYNIVLEESEEGLRNLDAMTEVEFKPLLFHCKLYIFAQMWLIASLKQLTLCKLHESLQNFHLDLASSDDVLEVIEFVFANTERGEDRDDELRKLLVAYAASKMKMLKQNASFRTLLDAHGQLGSDIIQVLG